MDEQRIQAYVELIKQLLGCLRGQEAEVLQSQTELVDAGLLILMEQVAAYLDSQGNSSAKWLRESAHQLAQVSQTDAKSNLAREVETKNAEKFLLETLQLVSDSRGNPQRVYLVWSQQHTRFNLALLAVLPQAVAQLYAKKAEQQTNLAAILSNFGNLIVQFPLGLRWLNLELGIAAYDQALQVRTRDAFPEQWAATQNNLANAYSERIRGKRADNLEWAITAYEQVLQVYNCDAFPEDWAMTQNNLAAAYSGRIRGERADNLEQAITAYEQVLQVYTRNTFPEQWAMTKYNLAIAYNNRIRGERADNLEQAISYCEQALQVYTRNTFPEQWAQTLNNLANAYSERIQGKRVDNLEEAISCYKQALQVYTRSTFPEQWAQTLNNLAATYFERIQGKRADNVEKAISCCEQVLQVRTRDAFPRDWAVTQHNLANAYLYRIRGERADNLERSISMYEETLQVRTRDALPEDWAMTQNNLGVAYSGRIRGKRADNLEKAISCYEKALQVRTYDAFPKDWAQTLSNLATTYFERIQGEHTDNLEQAISACKQVLQICGRDTFPEQWAATQNNLANVYSCRIRGERASNLEQAIFSCNQALQVYTRDAFPEQWAKMQNNLGAIYLYRIQGEQGVNLERSVFSYEQALQVYTCNDFPKECRISARTLGNLYFEQRIFTKAAEVYETALSASEILYQACILLDSKAAELVETASLFRYTAYSLARIDNVQKAVEVLERGRARGLSETLDRDRADLTQLQQTAPHLYEQYQDITNQLQNLESQQRDRSISSDRHSLTPETFRNTATQLRSELETTIAQIRQVEGYADFLDQPNFEDIRPALQPKRPLIYLVVTSAGSLALIITPDGIANLWLDDLTEAKLQELLQTWFNVYNQFQSDRQNWLNVIDSVSHQLWQPLMEPLVSYLKSHNFDRAVLVPTGYLSLLPLHAAWTEDTTTPTGRRYALDDIHFTYTPNAKSLTAAQAIATRTPADSILAIDNPTQDLPNSEREVQSAIAHFPQHQVLRHGEVQAAIAHFPQHQVLRHREATIASVREALQHCNILHLSCHGTANLQEPLTSGLLMSDGLLTLKDILALNLAESATGGIRLAILSACETGLTGIENADEAIGLPTGLLQAGVAGVIGSLWSVSELSTMILLTRFYDFWRKDGLEPAIALNQAQRWMHSTTDGEKAQYCGLITSNPSDRTYAHPFHWAAFSYLGV